MNLRKKFIIETYNIGFISTPVEHILSAGIAKDSITWMKHGYRDRFFADPFLLDSDDNNYYVLCEEYIFSRMKGTITLLTVDRHGYSLKDRRVIIEEPWHLSFPFCYRSGSEIYVIPESANSGKAFRYRIDRKTFAILDRTELIDEPLLDAVQYTDSNGIKWLYATKSRQCDDLFAYRQTADGLFSPVSKEPVIQANKRIARSAGAFFKTGGALYRPVQDCEERYGKYVHILQMERTGDQGFSGKEVQKIESTFCPPFSDTLHTFNVYDGIVIVDGSADFVRFPMKIIYRLRYKFNRIIRGHNRV